MCTDVWPFAEWIWRLVARGACRSGATFRIGRPANVSLAFPDATKPSSVTAIHTKRRSVPVDVAIVKCSFGYEHELSAER